MTPDRLRYLAERLLEWPLEFFENEELAEYLNDQAAAMEAAADAAAEAHGRNVCERMTAETAADIDDALAAEAAVIEDAITTIKLPG